MEREKAREKDREREGGGTKSVCEREGRIYCHVCLSTRYDELEGCLAQCHKRIGFSDIKRSRLTVV